MRKILLIILAVFILGCDGWIDFSEGMRVEGIRTIRDGGVCEYTVRAISDPQSDFTRHIVDDCGEYNIGDVIYLKRIKE
jgi:hypothetical protein